MLRVTKNLSFGPQKLSFLVQNSKFSSSRQNTIPLTDIKRPSLKGRAFAQERQIQRMGSDHSAILHAKALAAQARLRNADPPANPSKRTPDYSWRLNTADRLEKALNEAGFQSWGFPIYRCTYQSDSDWAEFLRRYRWHMAESLKKVNGLDLLESFKMTVFENQALFEDIGVNKDTATIREHFQQWATAAVQEEQGVSPNMLAFANVEAARYRVCLFVNQESLESILQTPLDDCLNKNAFVNMLNGWWKQESLNDHHPEDLEDDELEALRLELNGHEPIEGFTVKDVGWMKVALCGAGLEGFYTMGQLWEWDRHYERPPDICHSLL